ncbi:MAG TPA: molybdopterin-synthase adenylyltransferase MoeB, partial [Chryseolinea sp.]|nr:molybdopterin-synthase adenylyltransferase MoeB [Chryseolinea sp.]
MANLTHFELIRYNRHLILKDFGEVAQLKLKNASVLVVGAGGLGSPALLYLTAAGVGTLGIIDFDTVDLSNLQRQVIFTAYDVGKNKAEAASIQLSKRNPLVLLKTYSEKLTSFNALDLIKDYDVVIDGTDNFPTRYLINDACVLLNKPFVYGSILTYEGQVSVFNYLDGSGDFSANYRDLFPEPPDPSTVQNCEEAGVLGVLPGIIGTLQANEVIKIITGIGEVLSNKLLLFDSLTLQQNIVHYKSQQSRLNIKYLIDYDDFCGVSHKKSKSLSSNPNKMKEVTVQELQKLKESGADFQLIDVREPHEFDICDLGGELIPQAEIPSNVDKIAKNKQVVIHCRSGARSGNMVQWLEKNHGFENLYNLKGGILA